MLGYSGFVREYVSPGINCNVALQGTTTTPVTEANVARRGTKGEIRVDSSDIF